MSKQKKGMVPELRFPEFEKEPNWPCVKLNAVAKRSTSKNKGEKVSRVLTNSAVDGVVDQRDYFEKDIAVKGNLESYYIVDEGDYVYNPRISSTAPVGPISKNKIGKGVMSPLYTVFKFNSKKNGFFEQFFKSSRWHGYLQTISNSGARHDRMSVTSSEFMAMPVPSPGDMEQQKIADCLASIDELIALHTQKLDALKDHKKGLMQQLFPVEGEAVPKLRFPEFKGDWVEVMLGQAAKYENGKAHEQDIDARGQYIVVNSKFISTAGEIRKFSNSANLLAEKDDILMVLSDVPNGRAIAKCFYVDKDEKYTVNQRICKLTAKKGYVSKLLYYVIDKNSYFLEFDDGVKQTNLKKDDVLNCPLWVPNDIKEQKKIVGLLDSIDDSIFHQERKLLSLKSHKAGLLQKLFPVMDDVVS